jgi:multidrug efflux pump
MHLSAPFIKRPVATSLLSLALLLAGSVAYSLLPVASLPNVDFPVIGISAALPGASPETMASSVATPLERQFGRIASVNQMTSISTLGAGSVVLQFDINRDIDAAARDVQAAINAARNQLPTDLPQNPSYRKANPAESPILILTLTSDVVPKPQIYDMADSILAQKIAQIDGVGQVFVFGSSSPAVRVELNPMQLGSNGIGLEAVRTALANANANRPKGGFQDAGHRWQIGDNDQIFTASDYAPIIAGYNRQTGAPVRISDLGTVVDSVADIHTAGISGINPEKGPPGQLKDAVLVVVFKSPGANVISTVDNVMGKMARLQASIPPTIKIDVAMDRTTTIRASVHDVEISLLISVALVVLVVFLFLREVWATIIPSIAVPLSLVGTFGVMYLLGYTIDNLSLMALTIATGFVVDDAIVVIENITRYLEDGMSPFDAAMRGRLHSDSAHGRHCGQAFSRVCRHPQRGHCGFAAGFAHMYSHALRAVSEAARRKPPRSHLPLQRGRFPASSLRIQRGAALGVAPPDADSRRGHRHGVPECISLHDRAQRLLPAAGHRPAGRSDHGRAGHQLSRHARQAAPACADDARRSGCALGHGFRRRRPQQQ